MTKLKLEGGRNNSNPFVIIEKSICFFSDINGILIITILLLILLLLLLFA